jgi:hypothetical protein
MKAGRKNKISQPELDAQPEPLVSGFDFVDNQYSSSSPTNSG